MFVTQNFRIITSTTSYKTIHVYEFNEHLPSATRSSYSGQKKKIKLLSIEHEPNGAKRKHVKLGKKSKEGLVCVQFLSLKKNN